MSPHRFIALSVFCLTSLCAAAQTTQPIRLAFGSCLQQWKPAPALAQITLLQPDAMLMLGDNMYSDTGLNRLLPLPDRIGRGYQSLAEMADFREFRQQLNHHSTPLLAVWDDHDYGENDGGGDFPYRQQSKDFFTDFFQINSTATGDNQPGIYRSHYLERQGLRIQLLLLDTRSFRSPLQKNRETANCPRKTFTPATGPDATLLGDTQWQWLENELQQPADLRLLVTSIQLLSSEHCFEKWANFPDERARFFSLLNKTRANGVIVLSGDRHMADISNLTDTSLPYPLWEMTSSGLNSAIGSRRDPGPNSLRTASPPVTDNNFGMVELTKSANDNHWQISLQIFNERGEMLSLHELPLKALQPRADK